MIHGQHRRNGKNVGIDFPRPDHGNVFDPGQYAREARRPTRGDLDPSDPGEHPNRDHGIAHNPGFLRDDGGRGSSGGGGGGGGLGGVLLVSDDSGIRDDVVQHRVGRSWVRAGVRVTREPIETHLGGFVNVILAAVGQEQLPRDVLDMFGAVHQLAGEEPEVDDVVGHDAQML